MMRLFRMAVIAVFAITLLAFSFLFVKNEVLSDRSYPVIEMDKDIIDVSVNAKDKELLKGVTAHDKRDGDLTDRIIVESISKFTSPGVCNITYAVCDNDNHVTSATRKIRYKKYTAPKFYLNRSLCYSLYENINLHSALGAKDVLDGDISANIITTSSTFETGKVGMFKIKATTTNSKGDMVEITIPMFVEDRSVNAPEITLSKYLIYVKKGQNIDFRSYVKSALDSYENSVLNTLRIDSEYKKDKEGVYSVHYYAKDALDRQGHTVLTVVCS